MVSATNGLYCRFHNIQYRRHGLSRLSDNGFFSEDLGFLKIPCISHAPILEGKLLSKKSADYIRANTVSVQMLEIYLSIYCKIQYTSTANINVFVNSYIYIYIYIYIITNSKHTIMTM
jgi:hypothetical protein